MSLKQLFSSSKIHLCPSQGLIYACFPNCNPIVLSYKPGVTRNTELKAALCVGAVYVLLQDHPAMEHIDSYSKSQVKPE